MNAIKGMSILIIVSLIFMGSIGFAIQDRRPVDPPTPTPAPQEPECPTSFVDQWCGETGTASDKVYAWALSMAGNACQYGLNECYTEQGDEIAKNKRVCEAVTGCKLKYTVTFDPCELGGYKNCDPLPGTVPEDKNTIYTCVIKGEYDPEGYRCDRGPANEGEQTA